MNKSTEDKQEKKSNDSTISGETGSRSGHRPEVTGAGAFADSVTLLLDTVTAVVEQASENANTILQQPQVGSS